MKNLFCLLSLILVIALLVGCTPQNVTPDNSDVDNNTGNNNSDDGEKNDSSNESGNDEPADTAKTIASLVIASDTHIGQDDTTISPESKFTSALEQLKTVFPDYDALVIAGDMTDYGKDAEYDKFLEIWNEGKKEDATLLTMLGNHEFFRDGVIRSGGEGQAFLTEVRQAYTSRFGDLNTDTVIGGVHVICISVDNSIANYSSSEQFIIEHVTAAAEEDPNMPIIVIAHEGAGKYYDTGWGNFTQATLDCLNQYPQIIFFSGHTHRSLYDPRMIQQENFTTIQTGTLGADLWNYSFISPRQSERKDEVSEGHLVSVKEDGTVIVTRYDFFRQTTIGKEWIIDIPAIIESKDNFTYTDNRASSARSPVFPEDATVSVSNVTATSAKISFPAASVKDKVSDGQIFRYYITVTVKGNSQPILTERILAEYYLGEDATDIYTYDLASLPKGSTLVVRVRAETPWNRTAVISSAEFTTPEA